MGRKTKVSIVGLVASCVTTVWLIAGANAAVVVGSLSGVPLAPGSSGLFGHFTSTANAGQLNPSIGGGQVITFAVTSPSSISALSATINLGLIGIRNFNVQVVEQVGSVFNVFPGTSSGPGSVVTLSYAGLVAGKTYGLLFTGSVVGPLGGLYTGAYSIAAVPLPAGVWLFLSALIGLVGVIRSRRKGPAEAASGHEVAAVA